MVLELRHPEGAGSRSAVHLHQKEPAEVVRPSDQIASWTPSFGVFQACPTGRTRMGALRTCWRVHIYHLTQEFLGGPKEELESIAGERDLWTALLSLLPL